MGPAAVDVGDREFGGQGGCHLNESGAVEEVGVAGESGDDEAGEFGTFAVGEIKPALAGGVEDRFGANESGVEGDDGDVVGTEFVGGVGGEFVGGGFGDSVDCVAHVFLCRPETDVDDEAGACGNHEAGSESGGDESGANAGIHHGSPAVEGLLPEGARPSELAVFHHPFVTAPGRIYKQVE